MSKKKINFPASIEQTVMLKVRANEIAMKPKWYFFLGSVLTIIGFTASTIAAIFLINLSLFLLKDHGPMGEWRLQQILASFPLWVPILAIAGIASGIWLLKKFDLSYKRNFLFVIISFIFAILLASFILDYSGLSTVWFRQGQMRRFYRQNQNVKDFSYPAEKVPAAVRQHHSDTYQSREIF